MRTIRYLGILLLFLTLQASAADQAALKTGVQSLGPGALPDIGDKDPMLKWDFDLAREKFYIYVPKNYTGNQPFGLLVYISPSDESVAVPPGWEGVLQEKKLIYIAPQNAGNKQVTSRRMGLAVLAARKMMERARIDTNRVYAAGFSGGARMASCVSFLRPSLFSGVFAVCGVDFPGKVPRVKATEKDDYGNFTIEEQKVAEAKNKVKFVLVTGSKDFRYGNILDIYSGGFQKDKYDVKLIDVPGMEHTICSAKTFGDGIAFLDKKKAAVPQSK